MFQPLSMRSEPGCATRRSSSRLAVGHRVVHGGPEYDRPVLVDGEVLAHLERYVSLAPLHQPNNLAPIRALLARSPGLPQVACFDTAFHRGHSAVADHYAIPERFYAEGVRRYGFHGLSYEYIAERLREIAPDIASGRVIVAHLGSGASMCAMSGGRSVESTMGFTALDGLPMGTRPGQLDPGVVIYLIAEKGMSPSEVARPPLPRVRPQRPLRHQQRCARARSQRRSACRIRSRLLRVPRRAAGRHAGRCSRRTRCLRLHRRNRRELALDAGAHRREARLARRRARSGANAGRGPLISTKESRVALYVLPTDEELMIARHTLALLSALEPALSKDVGALPPARS